MSVKADARAAFEDGLLALETYLMGRDEADLAGAVRQLRAATELDPDVPAHWVALGLALDAAGEGEGALEALERALALDPEDHHVEVYALTLRSEAGPEDEALEAVEAVARRRGIELEPLRRELAAACMQADSGTLVLNAFIRARNFIRSRLQDEMDRVRRERDPAAARRRAASEREECRKLQEELRRSVDPAQVPESFCALTPWAMRLGVGDDVCRPELMERLTARERAEVVDLVEAHASAVHQWLDGFGEGPSTPEAGAFLYLLLAVEEAGGAR